MEKVKCNGAQARYDNYQNKGRGGNNGRGRVFPMDMVGEVTHHVVAGIKWIFAKRKLKRGRITKLRLFIKIGEVTQSIPKRKI